MGREGRERIGNAAGRIGVSSLYRRETFDAALGGVGGDKVGVVAGSCYSLPFVGDVLVAKWASWHVQCYINTYLRMVNQSWKSSSNVLPG